MLGIFHFWGWLLHGTNQCTGAYTEADKKKGQPVKVGLDSVGTRMFAGFPEMVQGPESNRHAFRRGILSPLRYSFLCFE